MTELYERHLCSSRNGTTPRVDAVDPWKARIHGSVQLRSVLRSQHVVDETRERKKTLTAAAAVAVAGTVGCAQLSERRRYERVVWLSE